MFDIGFSEVCLIGIMSMALFTPNDMVKILRQAHKYLINVKQHYNQYKDYLYKELMLDPEHQIIDYITDQEGNLREVYDLSNIAPNINQDSNLKDGKN